MQIMKQQLETDMEQQAGSKLGKQYVKAVYYVYTHGRCILMYGKTNTIL